MDQEIRELTRAYEADEPGAEDKLKSAHVRSGFVLFTPKPGRCHDRERLISEDPLRPVYFNDSFKEIMAEVLRVTIVYQDGGGVSSKRGYWLEAMNEGRSYAPDGFVRSTIFDIGAGCGHKILIESASRFSRKRFEALAPAQETIDNMKARTIAKWFGKQRCAVDGCEAKPTKRNLCDPHYHDAGWRIAAGLS